MVLHKQQVMVEKVENTPPAERRVQAIRLTHYDGSLGKALELFLDQVGLTFEDKTLDYTHEANRKHHGL
ncbi:hypothetical protein PI124_g14231 [Phytophthora idaei]|nr:hypothetical protein PI125_g11512 [Phytophthora idaei]KAG3146968.1 hypothetical protein PI126_g13084 [Phytophthora idaei]KAG3240882.1 hypothetical protein PI124_g14231 [Phytophthora idaei]